MIEDQRGNSHNSGPAYPEECCHPKESGMLELSSMCVTMILTPWIYDTDIVWLISWWIIISSSYMEY